MLGGESLCGKWSVYSDLPTDTAKRLRDLLTEREETAADAREMARDRKMPREQQQLVIQQSQNEVEEEIKAAVDDGTYKEIRNVIAAGRYLDQVQTEYGMDMAYNGAGLSGRQATLLALLLRQTYDRDLNPDAQSLRTKASGDPSGISVLDQQLLTRAAGVLSPKQLEVLKQSLSASTREVLEAKALAPK
jgi:hypothetical protein